MSASTSQSRFQSGSDVALAELVEGFTRRFHAGEVLDVEAAVAAHPEHADELRRLLPALQALADLSRSASGDAAADAGVAVPGGARLGDFHILREVGRGGMGVVYEAEQLSLSRRVALKVLPFAATMNPRQLQRFHNEARAAASLHHDHIVPVYAVGCEGAVHFYAMQLIQGKSLAGLLAAQGAATAPQPSPPAGADTHPVAAAPTQLTPSDATYHRRVAKWGIQAALALEHAHSLGIVHRDVKPGNLMIDGQGKLWITDFGLASTAADTGLTMTGDLLGTLRYMSPEQALARLGLVDHRTDVYSLGATLYELLTGRPAVEGQERQEILRHIADEEPRQPRALDRTIPADLETIVLKTLAKEPGERYATAHELAEDLKRFVENKPIQACRASLVQRGQKWVRRHRVVMASVAVCSLVALVTLLVATVAIWQKQRETAAAYRIATEKKEEAEEQRQAAQDSAAEARRSATVAEKERRRAEDNLRKAVEAWGQSFEFFLERPPSKDTPELAAARKAQTEQATQFMRKLLADVENDPARRFEAALVHYTLGNIFRARLDHSSSEKEYTEAVSIYRGLVEEKPDEARYQAGLDELYWHIILEAWDLDSEAARLSGKAGREKQIIELYCRASRLNALLPANWLPTLSASHIRHAATQKVLVEPLRLLNLAQHLYAGGRPAEAETSLNRSITLAETVPAHYPGRVYLQYFWWHEAKARSLRGADPLGNGTGGGEGLPPGRGAVRQARA
jgi:serine/threonine protein kinase